MSNEGMQSEGGPVVAEPAVRCEECRVVDIAKWGHNWLCTQQTPEQFVKSITRIKAHLQDTGHRYHVNQQRLREMVTLWQGKHALVRHENNVLRRKLRALSAEKPPTPPPASVSPTVLQAHILPDDSKA